MSLKYNNIEKMRKTNNVLSSTTFKPKKVNFTQFRPAKNPILEIFSERK